MFTDVSAVLPSSGWHVESGVCYGIYRRMQIIQTVSACQDAWARDQKNEKSQLIPIGASVLNLKMSLISSRCLRSLCSSPTFTTATRMSSSEWLRPLKCCATGRSPLLCSSAHLGGVLWIGQPICVSSPQCRLLWHTLTVCIICIRWQIMNSTFSMPPWRRQHCRNVGEHKPNLIA